jgi:hypothetical protein
MEMSPGLGRPRVNENQHDIFRPDTRFYNENRTKIPPEDLVPYAGQWVAWTPDGTRIVAHGEDMLTVAAQMRAAGLDPSDVVWEAIPGPDEDCFL